MQHRHALMPTRRFRLVEGGAIAEIDLCERADLPGYAEVELRLLAPGLRARVVAPVPGGRLFRFAADLGAIRTGRHTTATLRAAGASEVWLRVRDALDGPRLSIHARQYGDHMLRFVLRDLALSPDAFRQLLDWATQAGDRPD